MHHVMILCNIMLLSGLLTVIDLSSSMKLSDVHNTHVNMITLCIFLLYVWRLQICANWQSTSRHNRHPSTCLCM